MKVSEIMTKKAVSIGSQEPVSAAAKLMWDCDCGAVPVIENDKVIGMITDRDICMSTFLNDRSPSGLRVAEAMSRQLYYCAPSDTVAFAEEIMRSKQIRRLPVLDDSRRLVGILSLADIARRGEISTAKGSTNELGADQITLTLANICQPAQAMTSGGPSGMSAR